MVQLTVKLAATSGRAHELVEALRELLRHTRHRACCAHVAADVDEANTFWYCEDWQEAEALERELRSERFSQLLALMETSPRPPVVEFRVVSETRGLEYVAAVRAAAGQQT